MVAVCFLHPDLGIGGAERLVVDAGLSLQSKGHSVTFVTSHHDKSHCFSETRNGTLSVVVAGDWLPRNIAGKFYALFAYIRMIYAALYLLFWSDVNYNVLFLDQISAPIPLLKLFLPKKTKIIFYCHFPDQLLTKRTHFLKKLYRRPLDWIEEKSTGMADIVFVNSKFTAGIYHDTFKSLKNEPSILYPSLNTRDFDRYTSGGSSSLENPTFISLNRYERKKNHALAIKAFGILTRSSFSSMNLIIAGGYDHQNRENIEHYKELVDLAEKEVSGQSVIFMKSPDNDKKLELLKNCTALLYTPSHEHFGIVPVEAMYCQLPVVAVNSGGPLETVVHDQTGFLVDPDPEAFAEAMKTILNGGPEYKRRLGEAGRQRVKKHFSFQSFTNQLNEAVTS